MYVLLIGQGSSDKRQVVILLCEISGFHGDDYEEYRLLGCGAV
jgi:hypothetical protein